MSIQTKIGWRIYTPVIPYSLDTNAQSFISAANITNTTQKIAINTLVSDLKSAGIWTKMKAIYPFVGGNATAHKFNLKDPRDLDAAFRLSFSGGWSHSTTGILPNGSNAFANTFLATHNVIANDSIHVSFYSRTDVTSTSCDIGGGQAPEYYVYIYPKYNNAGTVGTSVALHSLGTLAPIANNNSSSAFYLSSRLNSTQVSLFRNSTKLSLLNLTRTNYSDMSIIIGALNNGGIGTPNPAAYSTREQAFATIGDGLTDIEAANLYTAIQKYQTSLGRQV